jgi:hypothetical protein
MGSLLVINFTKRLRLSKKAGVQQENFVIFVQTCMNDNLLHHVTILRWISKSNHMMYIFITHNYVLTENAIQWNI